MTLTIKVRLTLIAALGLAILFVKLAGDNKGRETTAPPAFSPAAAAAAVAASANANAIRFLSARVGRDPDDHASQNQLAGHYLLRARAAGSQDDLALAFRAVRASLRSVGAERNTGGLAVLAQAELMAHAFAEARDHALQLSRLTPARSTPYQILGDALMEMGEYNGAEAAFGQMARRGGGVETETRFARLALLRGDAATATRRLTTALVLARNLSPPPSQTITWCHWQLGETAFSVGDYARAESHCRDALALSPSDAPARASLGRVCAARGDLAGAIAQYERAARLLPDNLAFAASLGDLYKLAGRNKDAGAHYARVEEIGRQGTQPGAPFDRSLALFYADHDLHPAEAHANAARVYKERPDIVGADILAWTALKAGRIAQAQAAINAALRLGTQDARLFYHAGMIARAAGDKKSARRHLQRALALSPQFDPLQAALARKALESVTEMRPLREEGVTSQVHTGNTRREKQASRTPGSERKTGS